MKRTIYLFTPTSARMFTDGVAQSGRCINCRVVKLVDTSGLSPDAAKRESSTLSTATNFFSLRILMIGSAVCPQAPLPGKIKLLNSYPLD